MPDDDAHVVIQKPVVAHAGQSELVHGRSEGVAPVLPQGERRVAGTEAAAATNEPKSGKAAMVNDWARTLGMIGSSSTTATVVAAQSEAVADVKGRMAPARAPWLA